jgi:hypothetical protein
MLVDLEPPFPTVDSPPSFTTSPPMKPFPPEIWETPPILLSEAQAFNTIDPAILALGTLKIIHT